MDTVARRWYATSLDSFQYAPLNKRTVIFNVGILLKEGIGLVQKREIPVEVSADVRTRMKSVWDINKYYWYPLSECKRDDLIAFNSEYIDSDEKLNEIIKLFKEHGENQVFEFLETGQTYEIEISNLYPYYCYNKDSTGGEGFWTSDKMDWIIYASHEGTITFGGEWLVKEIKSKWSDWKSNIDWDTKNLF